MINLVAEVGAGSLHLIVCYVCAICCLFTRPLNVNVMIVLCRALLDHRLY